MRIVPVGLCEMIGAGARKIRVLCGSLTTSSKSIFKSLTIILLLAGAFQYLLAARQKEGDHSPVHEGSSGFYDSMLIGVDKEKGELTGFFEDATGWDEQTKSPRFSCVFYIYGKLQGDKYQVTTWYPGDNDYIKGELRFVLKEDRREIDLRLEAEHGGCWNVHPFAKNASPVTLGLEKRGDWIGVKVVSANKAFFHKGPNAQMKGRAYLVKHDPVRVLKVQAESPRDSRRQFSLSQAATADSSCWR